MREKNDRSFFIRNFMIIYQDYFQDVSDFFQLNYVKYIKLCHVICCLFIKI